MECRKGEKSKAKVKSKSVGSHKQAMLEVVSTKNTENQKHAGRYDHRSQSKKVVEASSSSTSTRMLASVDMQELSDSLLLVKASEYSH